MDNLNDELAIRQLVSRYADGVNRYDAQTWKSTWAEQGQWQLREGQCLRGPDEIVKFWCSVMDSLEFAIMIPSSGQIKIDGKTATGRWYMQETVVEREGRGAEIVGVYNDHYIKINGSWLFQSRQYHMLYDSPTHPQAKHLPVPPEHLVPL